MEIDKTIREFMREAVEEVNHEQTEEIGHIMFANICIERFLEKMGEHKQ